LRAQDPSGHFLSPNEHEVLAVHLEIEDLQVPSSQSTGEEDGQMI